MKQNKATIQLIGQIGITKVDTNGKWVGIPVAVNKSHKNQQGEWETKTTWFQCWGKEYITKQFNQMVQKHGDLKGATIIVFGEIMENTKKPGEWFTQIDDLIIYPKIKN